MISSVVIHGQPKRAMSLSSAEQMRGQREPKSIRDYGLACSAVAAASGPLAPAHAGGVEPTIAALGGGGGTARLKPVAESRTAMDGPKSEHGLTVHRHRVPPLSDDDRVVAVVAPAGYGKTTLAASWFQSNCDADCTTWITLDESCRDASCFVRMLLRSENLAGDVAADALSRLVSKLENRPQRSSLFLDDVHLLGGSEGADYLTRLLTKLPRSTRLVLCGRSAMGLGLSGGSARGLVRWVTQEQLAFNADDLQELARIAGRALDKDGADRLLDLTEGWPALAQLALSIRATPLAGGESDVLLEGMVFEQFFKDIEANRREAFVAMAAAHEFTASMMEALEVSDVAAAIAEAEQLGIARQRGHVAGERRYVLHPMVAEALLHFGGARSGAVDALRSRCAAWWEAHGDCYRAVRLMLAANDIARAQQYLCAHASAFIERQGKHEAFLALLAQLESREPELGRLTLDAAWASAFLFQAPEFERWLSRADHWLAAGDSAESAHEAIRTTVAQRAMLGVLRDDPATTLSFANRWLAGGGGEVNDDSFESGVTHAVMAWGLKCRGDFFDAREHLRTAQARFEVARSPHGLAWIRVLNVATLIKAGRYREALAANASALEESEQHGIGGQSASLHALGALILCERDERGQARLEIEAALPLLPSQGLVDALIPGYAVAARLQAADGDVAGALEMLAEGERVGEARGFQRMRIAMGAERALLLLRNDEASAAQRLMEDLRLTPAAAQTGIGRDRTERIWARLFLAQGRPERTLDLTRTAIERARRSDQRHKLAELLVLQAVALSRQGEAAGAREAVEESLRIAALQGYKRLFLDEGKELIGLLRAFVLQPQLTSSTVAHARAVLASSSVAADATAFVEQRPTERELQLLAMLTQGLSNDEIADRLKVTQGTVKWHLHNLYGKLQVRNRTGALREAKSRGLLAG